MYNTLINIKLILLFTSTSFSADDVSLTCANTKKYLTKLQGEVTYLIDPTKSTNYFICANGVPLLFNCGDGKLFSQKTFTCKFKSKVKHFDDVSSSNCNGRIACSERHEKKYITHPSDCRKYFKCKKGKPVMYNCRKELQFSDEKQKCVHPEKAFCNTKCPNNTQSEFDGEKCDPTIICSYSYTYQAHPTDCTKYYKCKKNKPKIYDCSNGLYFSYQEQRCVNRHLSECKDRCKKQLDIVKNATENNKDSEEEKVDSDINESSETIEIGSEELIKEMFNGNGDTTVTKEPNGMVSINDQPTSSKVTQKITNKPYKNLIEHTSTMKIYKTKSSKSDTQKITKTPYEYLSEHTIEDTYTNIPNTSTMKIGETNSSGATQKITNKPSGNLIHHNIAETGNNVPLNQSFLSSILSDISNTSTMNIDDLSGNTQKIPNNTAGNLIEHNIAETANNAPLSQSFASPILNDVTNTSAMKTDETNSSDDTKKITNKPSGNLIEHNISANGDNVPLNQIFVSPILNDITNTSTMKINEINSSGDTQNIPKKPSGNLIEHNIAENGDNFPLNQSFVSSILNVITNTSTMKIDETSSSDDTQNIPNKPSGNLIEHNISQNGNNVPLNQSFVSPILNDITNTSTMKIDETNSSGDTQKIPNKPPGNLIEHNIAETGNIVPLNQNLVSPIVNDISNTSTMKIDETNSSGGTQIITNKTSGNLIKHNIAGMDNNVPFNKSFVSPILNHVSNTSTMKIDETSSSDDTQKIPNNPSGNLIEHNIAETDNNVPFNKSFVSPIVNHVTNTSAMKIDETNSSGDTQKITNNSFGNLIQHAESSNNVPFNKSFVPLILSHVSNSSAMKIDDINSSGDTQQILNKPAGYLIEHNIAETANNAPLNQSFVSPVLNDNPNSSTMKINETNSSGDTQKITNMPSGNLIEHNIAETGNNVLLNQSFVSPILNDITNTSTMKIEETNSSGDTQKVPNRPSGNLIEHNVSENGNNVPLNQSFVSPILNDITNTSTMKIEETNSSGDTQKVPNRPSGNLIEHNVSENGNNVPLNQSFVSPILNDITNTSTMKIDETNSSGDTQRVPNNPSGNLIEHNIAETDNNVPFNKSFVAPILNHVSNTSTMKIEETNSSGGTQKITNNSFGNLIEHGESSNNVSFNKSFVSPILNHVSNSSAMKIDDINSSGDTQKILNKPAGYLIEHNIAETANNAPLNQSFVSPTLNDITNTSAMKIDETNSSDHTQKITNKPSENVIEHNISETGDNDPLNQSFVSPILSDITNTSAMKIDETNSSGDTQKIPNKSSGNLTEHNLAETGNNVPLNQSFVSSILNDITNTSTMKIDATNSSGDTQNIPNKSSGNLTEHNIVETGDNVPLNQSFVSPILNDITNTSTMKIDETNSSDNTQRVPNKPSGNSIEHNILQNGQNGNNVPLNQNFVSPIINDITNTSTMKIGYTQKIPNKSSGNLIEDNIAETGNNVPLNQSFVSPILNNITNTSAIKVDETNSSGDTQNIPNKPSGNLIEHNMAEIANNVPLNQSFVSPILNDITNTSSMKIDETNSSGDTQKIPNKASGNLIQVNIAETGNNVPLNQSFVSSIFTDIINTSTIKIDEANSSGDTHKSTNNPIGNLTEHNIEETSNNVPLNQSFVPPVLSDISNTSTMNTDETYSSGNTQEISDKLSGNLKEHNTPDETKSSGDTQNITNKPSGNLIEYKIEVEENVPLDKSSVSPIVFDIPNTSGTIHQQLNGPMFYLILMCCLL